ncbi:MAG: ABC transporter ATP-binding protein [Pirellulaceae bacterium]|nr:ABC transporter ATP-binding protein [Pirellulaceae bacterium]
MSVSNTCIARIESVCKSYGARRALSDVSLELPPGVTGLLGPNGSGKSTLIKALLGLVKVDSGSGQVLGLPWPGQTRALRDRVGFLPEDDCYIHGLQGIESIQMMARLSGLHHMEALRRAHELADFSDLGQERYRNVETYSTGMRQKLKFAQALVHDPELVVLDEPTTGLDPSQRESLLDRVRVLSRQKGKSVLLSTHILHDVQRVCDQVIILVRGQVRLVDSLANLQRPSEATLFVQVVSDAVRLQQALANSGVTTELVSDQGLLIRGDQADVSRIWSGSQSCNVLIQRIEPARNSLEQTFLDAVAGG